MEETDERPEPGIPQPNSLTSIHQHEQPLPRPLSLSQSKSRRDVTSGQRARSGELSNVIETEAIQSREKEHAQAASLKRSATRSSKPSRREENPQLQQQPLINLASLSFKKSRGKPQSREEVQCRRRIGAQTSCRAGMGRLRSFQLAAGRGCRPVSPPLNTRAPKHRPAPEITL